MSAEAISGPYDNAVRTPAIQQAPFEISDIRPGRNFDVAHVGHYFTEKVVFSDGVAYDKRLCLPSRSSTYDTPVVFTTPWFTGIDGFNTEVAKVLNARGIPVLIIGYPEMHQATFRRMQKVGLLKHDAHAQQQILDNEEGMAGLHYSKVISDGYSRGGMAGFGVLASAAAYKREVAYFDFIDPCLEHPVGKTETDPRQFVGYLGREAIEAVKIILTSKNRRRLLKTFQIGPRQLRQHRNVGEALFRGEAGPLARNVPLDAIGRITLFDGSRLNHAAAYKKHFSAYPYIHLDPEPGYHMTGIDTVLSSKSADRIELAEELIKDGVPLKDINWKNPPPP